MAVLDLGKVVPEKGVDYFTESDINTIESEVVEDVKETVKVSDLQNDAGYITKDVNNLTNYTKSSDLASVATSGKASDLTNDSGFVDNTVDDLVHYTLGTSTGSTIELSINSSTYVMTLNLKNSAGTTISTDSIDLPLETMVVGATYDSQNKKIVLELKNGTTVDVPVGDLVSGLQSEITAQNKLASDLVDDTNQTNKFVTSSEKTTWSGKQDALVSGTNIKTINGTTVLGSGDIATEIIQYSTLPTADENTYGDIIQYVGDTTYDLGGNVEYQKGMFYICDRYENTFGETVIYNYYWTAAQVSKEMFVDHPIRFVNYNYFGVYNEIAATFNNMSDTYGEIYICNKDKKKYIASALIEATEIGANDKIVFTSLTESTNNIVTLESNGTWGTSSLELQEKLVSGTNVKTINGSSILGSGDITTEIIQYSTMPTASASNEGQIVQYTGTTDANYTKGYYYQVISDGQTEPTYSWENIEVQPSSVANVSYLIANFPSTRVESRSYIILITGSENISSYYWDAMKDVLVSAINDSRILYPKKIYFGIYMPDMTFNTWDAYDSTSTSTQSTRYKVQKFDGQYKESNVYIFNNSGTINFNLSYNDLTSNLSTWNVYTYGAQTIEGVKTFSSLPQSSVTPSNNNDLVNKSYVDSAISSAITDALGGNY